MRFLKPRMALTGETVLRLVHAPVWPEKQADYGQGVRIKSGGAKACRFCNLDEEPLQDYGTGYLLPARFPYIPRHAMLVPKGHFQSIEFLPQEKFAQLVGVMGEILRERPKTVFGANLGEVAGQSIPHLHVHVLEHPLKEEESELGIRPIMPGMMIADALGRRIIARASELGQPVHPTENLREYPSVRLYFNNPAELADSQHKIAEVIAGLRKAFASLKRKFPEPSNRMIRRDINKGVFGYNWMVTRYGRGIVFEIMPRAAGPPIGVLEKSQGRRGGMILNRQKQEPSENWARQQEEYYAFLQATVTPR